MTVNNMKLLKSLTLIIGITVAGITLAVPSKSPDLTPAQGLTVCAAVYADLSQYGSTDSQRILRIRSLQIQEVAKKYNPNVSEDVLQAMKTGSVIVAQGDNDSLLYLDMIKNAEEVCRTQYLPQFGL